MMSSFWLYKLNTSSSDCIYTRLEREGADAHSQTNQVATQLSPEVLSSFIGLLKELLMRSTGLKSRA